MAKKTSAEALTKLFADCDWLKQNLEPYWKKVKDKTITDSELETYIERLAEYIAGYKDYSSGFIADLYSGNPLVNMAKTGLVMTDNLEKTFGFDLSAVKKFLAMGSVQAKKEQVEGPKEEASQEPKSFGDLPNPLQFLSQLMSLSKGDPQKEAPKMGENILGLLLKGLSQGSK